MTLLTWLAASSLIWGGVLWLAAIALQRSADVSGRARQWIWRGATALLVAPWLAAPVIMAMGWGLAPNEAPVVSATRTAMPMMEFSGEKLMELPGAIVAAAPQMSLPEILLILLAAGWIVRFVAAQLAARSLLGIVAMSREAEHGPASTALQAWSQRLGLKRAPRLRIVGPGVSPFSFGILRPVICLPEGLERQLNREALDLVVGHECLHVARGDGWRRPLERITADIFWFNPFAWAMRREVDMARELACDEGVVALSSARKAYARTLRDVAGFSAGLSHSAPAASMSLGGSGRSLMLRMSRTLALAKRRPARAVMFAACLAGLIAAPIAVAQVAFAVPRAPEAPPAPPAAPVAPAESAAAPQPPAPAEPTQIYMSDDGLVRIAFPARVVWIGGDLAHGYAVKLVQSSGVTRDGKCSAELEGLGALKLAREQVVAEGAVIAVRGNHKSVRFSVSCSDDESQPIPEAPQPPQPPQAPEARGSNAPTPLAAPAPLAPLAAPRPLPAPAVKATPLTPVTPLTLPTPVTPPRAPTSPPAPVKYQLPAGKTIQLTLDNATSPVVGAPGRLTSGYGFRTDPFSSKTAFHEGVDITAYVDAPILAPKAGVVTFAGTQEANGRVVELDLGNGVQMRFTHLATFTVEVGASMKAGEKIGTMGSSGRSTGPHLHLEVWYNGKGYDPETVQGLTLFAPG